MSALIVFVVTLAVAMVVNTLLTPLILVMAHRYHLFDRTDHRKNHQGQIPPLGGIGIFLSFIIAGVVSVVLADGNPLVTVFSWRYLSILAGAALMHITGVVDDMLDIAAGRKLMLQITAAALAVSGGIAFESLAFPVLGRVLPLSVLALPLSVLWIVSLANAVNLVDGIDGFAGGITLVAALSLGIIALVQGNLLVMTIAAALTGAVAGFLFFNFPPARIFMGDGGSLFLGFSLALLSMMGGPAPAIVAVPVMLLSIPILDTIIAITRRTRRGLPIHTPDANHFHHRLLRLAGTPRRTLLYAGGLNLWCGAGAVVYALLGGVAGAIALMVVAVTVVVVFTAVFRIA